MFLVIGKMTCNLMTMLVLFKGGFGDVNAWSGRKCKSLKLTCDYTEFWKTTWLISWLLFFTVELQHSKKIVGVNSLCYFLCIESSSFEKKIKSSCSPDK